MAKKIFTAALLVFVATSLAVMVFRDNECGCDKCKNANTVVTTQPDKAEFVVGYYLIGPKRCDTCKQLEEWTRATVEKNFADDLKSGRMKFSVINTDEAPNAHWVKDFDMSFKTVVISQIKDGKPVRWERFDDVWKYVKEDQAAYDAYLADGITQFMKGDEK